MTSVSAKLLLFQHINTRNKAKKKLWAITAIIKLEQENIAQWEK